MSRWARRRRGGTPGPAAGPRVRDESVLAVEEYEGVVLLRSASDDALGAADIDDLARSLASDDGMVTVVTGADAASASALWPRLATLLDSLREEDVTSVRLVMSGAGLDRPDREAPARRIADAWGMEVIAPDAVVLVVPGGGLFVTRPRPDSREEGGWWRFTPGAEPVALGPRQPVPAWQPQPVGATVGTAAGCVVEQIPAGLLVRPKDALAPRPGDLCYAIPVDRHGPLVLVGVPDGEDVLPADVAEAVETLPPRARSRVRLAPGGRRDVLATGRSLAGTRGHEVVVHTGLPLLPASGPASRHTVRATIADADGIPRWHPYVDAVVCGPDNEPDRAAPDIRLLRWTSPMPGRGEGKQGVLPLTDRWQVTLTRAGLWISGTDGAPLPIAGRPVSADGPVIEVGRPGEPLDLSLWPELSRLLTALGTQTCTRARLMVHGTCVDGGRALRQMAGLHNVRSVRFGRLPAPARIPAPVQVPSSVQTPAPAHAAVAPATASSAPGAPARGSAATSAPALSAGRSSAARRVPVPAAGGARPAARRIPLAQLLEPDTDPGPATAPAAGAGGTPPAKVREPAGPPTASAAGTLAAGPAGAEVRAASSPAGTTASRAGRTEGPSGSLAEPGTMTSAPGAAEPGTNASAGPGSNGAAPAPRPVPPRAATAALAPTGPGHEPAGPAPSAVTVRAATTGAGTHDPVAAAPAVTPATAVTAGPVSPGAAVTPGPAFPAEPEPSVRPLTTSAAPGTPSPATHSRTEPRKAEPLPPVPFRPGHHSTDAERAAFRALAQAGWERHGAAVARMLTRMPALRGREQEAARADLIAVQLYLRTQDGPLSPAALRHALTTGEDRLLPYAACVASGLRRLPAFRGAAVRGAGPQEAPTPGSLLRDSGPVSALPADGGEPVPGGARYVIASVTGRRVRQLYDGPVAGVRSDEVIFPPGTVFRVLDVRQESDASSSSLIFLRELPGSPPPSTYGGAPLDDQDTAALARLDEALSRSPVATDPGSWPDRCAGPVGRPHINERSD